MLRKIAVVVVSAGLTGVMIGCPTLTDSVLGGGTAGSEGVPPGDLIEWPSSQVDPTGEDTAGFNQVISADLNGDGLFDLITAAYESQPIQIHLQQRSQEGDISFRSLSVAGSGPIYQVSDLRVADVDQDGNLDIIVAARDNGFVPRDQCATRQCSILILFSPPDPADQLNWQRFNLTQQFFCTLVDDVPTTFSLLGRDGNDACYASIDVADVDDDGFPDVVAAFNGCDDDEIPTKEVQLWLNPANDDIRSNDTLIGSLVSDVDDDGTPDACSAEAVRPWREILLQLDFPDVTATRLTDVDRDDDLDIVTLRPDSLTFDISWQTNPLIPFGNVAVEFWGDSLASGVASIKPIGESEAGLDLLEIGDLDNDGLDDVLGLGQEDRLLRWFRHPIDAGAQQFPWDVFNIVQYADLTPTAMEISDVDQNGQLDVVAAADGRIRWFTPLGASPFDPWSEQFVVDDSLIPDGAAGSAEAPFAPINSVHAVDIDGDGRLDIAVTLDRTGVDSDAVIWLRNQEVDEAEE